MDELFCTSDALLHRLRVIDDLVNGCSQQHSWAAAAELYNDPEYVSLLRKRLLASSRKELMDVLESNERSGSQELFPSERIAFACISNLVPRQDEGFSLIYVYSGSTVFRINDREVPLRTGETCIFNAGILHSFTSQPDSIIISCMISSEYLCQILLERLSGDCLFSSFFTRMLYSQSSRSDCLPVDTSGSLKMKYFLASAIAEYVGSDLGAGEAANSYVTLFFTELLRMFIAGVDTQQYENLGQNKLSDVINYIQDNSADVTLASAARHFHFHPNYLSNAIKSFSGHTFTELVQEARLSKACAMLAHLDLPVGSISDSVGYCNVSYFYKLFKKRFGCSPNDYRLKHRKGGAPAAPIQEGKQS